jgi:hypothetical protein
MNLYREIAVWRRVNDSLAVRYQLIEDLSGPKFATQSADYFTPSMTYDDILALEKQFAERLMDDPSEREWSENIGRAIEDFDRHFGNVWESTS